MPIEIKELVIKATVQHESNTSPSASARDNVMSLKEQIVQDCMEKVAEMIKEKNER